MTGVNASSLPKCGLVKGPAHDIQAFSSAQEILEVEQLMDEQAGMELTDENVDQVTRLLVRASLQLTVLAAQRMHAAAPALAAAWVRGHRSGGGIGLLPGCHLLQ